MAWVSLILCTFKVEVLIRLKYKIGHFLMFLPSKTKIKSNVPWMPSTPLPSSLLQFPKPLVCVAQSPSMDGLRGPQAYCWQGPHRSKCSINHPSLLSDISWWILTSPCLDSLCQLLEDFRAAWQQRDTMEASEHPRKHIRKMGMSKLSKLS